VTTIPSPVSEALAAAGSRRPGLQPGHVVQFYLKDEFLLDQVRDFLGRALSAGSAAIVIATLEHRRKLEDRLLADGLDLPRLSSQGRYVSLDAAETLAEILVNGVADSGRFSHLVGGVIARAATACADSGSTVAAFGEMVALLGEQGDISGAIVLERLWNQLGGIHSFSLLCAYSMKDFSRTEHTEPFQTICGEHSHVIPSESYSSLGTEQDRSRAISRLQQKAQALEHETAAHKRAQESLQLLESANRSLQGLSARLLRLQEDERRRFAYELHERTGQDLALLGMNLSALELDASRLSPELAKELSETRVIAGRVAKDLREISYLMYPPLLEEMGLESALRWYIGEFSERTNIKVKLEFLHDTARLRSEVEITLYRALQECLANVQQHSGIAMATVSLHADAKRVILEVRDDGKEIAADAVSSPESAAVLDAGFRCMKERLEDLGGELIILPRREGGHVKIVLPCERGGSAPRRPQLWSDAAERVG